MNIKKKSYIYTNTNSLKKRTKINFVDEYIAWPYLGYDFLAFKQNNLNPQQLIIKSRYATGMEH